MAGSGLQKAVADWAHVAQFLFVAGTEIPREIEIGKRESVK